MGRVRRVIEECDRRGLVVILGFYAKLKDLTSPRSKPDVESTNYFPPPESQGGWRKLSDPDSIRTIAGMDPDKLTKLRAWLRDSDQRRVRRRDHPARLYRAGRGAAQQLRLEYGSSRLMLKSHLRARFWPLPRKRASRAICRAR